MNDWPFADPRNAATITDRNVVDHGAPILLVVHGTEDQDWLFLTGDEFDFGNGMVVSLASMIDRDPTLLELADLLPGWEASRTAVDQPWQRCVSEVSE